MLGDERFVSLWSAPMSELRSVLPSTVAIAERADPISDDATEEVLLRAERSYVAGAILRRRAEFATGRFCARAALASLGVRGADHTAITVGGHREPIWPTGIVGSITHCEGHFAAAVAHSSDIRAVGIDVERHAPIPEAVVAATSWPDELAALAADSSAIWPTVLFSAREAIYKAWYPVAGQWLGHHDVRLEIDPATGRFDVTFVGAIAPLAERRHLTALEGAARWNDEFVFSAVWVNGDQL